MPRSPLFRMASSSRLTSAASGAFLLAYLGFQVVYPVLSWVLPGYTEFTWHMYAGLNDRPAIVVVLDDGTERALGYLTRRGNAVRVLGPSVDIERFAPPRICATWAAARAIKLHTRDRDTVVPCPPRS